VAGTTKPEKGNDMSVAVHSSGIGKVRNRKQTWISLIPFFQTETSDRQLNSFKLFEPSVFGHFPFLDKAANPPLLDKGTRFPFSGEDLFPFWLLTRPYDRWTRGRRKMYLRPSVALQSSHRSPFDLSTKAHSLNSLQPNPQHQKCNSLVSSPLSWPSVSHQSIHTRFNHRSLNSLIVLAAASTLASPIPAASLAKKEVGAVDLNIIAREPEAPGSGLEILARDEVEAREPSPICPGRTCD
jgi:hypothetical protein